MYFPSSQTLHRISDEALPNTCSRYPGAHPSVHGEHSVCPRPGANFPALQAVHTVRL
jgi:hypothetical protein